MDITEASHPEKEEGTLMKLPKNITKHRPYPYGPKSEIDAIRACKEVGPDGLITGGPHTPDEWLHWNGAIACGWGGRYPMVPSGMKYEDGIFFSKND
jgi:hypothetical protein